VTNRRRPLTPAEEAAFQNDMTADPAMAGWSRNFADLYGEAPDLNSPDYDYRTAWRLGARPEPHAPDGGAFHWPSSVQPPPFAQPVDLKAPGHQTMWKQRFMTATGVDPDTIPPEERNRLLAPMANEDLRQTPTNIGDLFLPRVRP
jgi:hypothetical protein